MIFSILTFFSHIYQWDYINPEFARDLKACGLNTWRLETTFDSFHSLARLGSVVDIIQLNCLGSTIGAQAMGNYGWF
ncbi:hypothetical protein V6Z12_A10G267800 [Gossypium hirsutum]